MTEIINRRTQSREPCILNIDAWPFVFYAIDGIMDFSQAPLVQIPLERHAHSANGGMRLPDYSA